MSAWMAEELRQEEERMAKAIESEAGNRAHAASRAAVQLKVDSEERAKEIMKKHALLRARREAADARRAEVKAKGPEIEEQRARFKERKAQKARSEAELAARAKAAEAALREAWSGQISKLEKLKDRALARTRWQSAGRVTMYREGQLAARLKAEQERGYVIHSPIKADIPRFSFLSPRSPSNPLLEPGIVAVDSHRSPSSHSCNKTRSSGPDPTLRRWRAAAWLRLTLVTALSCFVVLTFVRKSARAKRRSRSAKRQGQSRQGQ